MSKACIKSVYDDLMKYVITLRQFKGKTQYQDKGETKRPFESLSRKERLNFAQRCTVELNSTYIFLCDFLVRNKGVIIDYVRSIEKLIDYNTEFDKIVELKRKLMEESSECFNGMLESILADLREIIKQLSDMLQISKEDFDTDNRWLIMLKTFSSRLKKCSPLYKNLGARIYNVQDEIHNAMTQQKLKICYCKHIVRYTSGESNYFPGENGNFVEDLLGGPSDDVERYLRQLVNENMARRDGSVEHLKIYLRSHKEHFAELEKLKALVSELTLFNILFSKFWKSQIFDILDKFQILLNDYEDLTEVDTYEH